MPDPMKPGGRSKPARMTSAQALTLPSGDHTDPACTGLMVRVRVRPRGTTRTGLFQYKWCDERVRLTIGHVPQMSLADARHRALELRRALDDGIDPRRSRPSRRQQPSPLPLSSDLAAADRHSVDYLVSEFTVRYLRLNRKRPEQAEWMLSRDTLRVWKGRDARSISSVEVIDLLDGIVDRGAKVLANRTASLLNLMFKFGVQRRIVPANPVQILMPPGGKEKPRSRVLTDTELKAFISDPHACTKEPRLAHCLMVLLLTGQRRAELVKAAWHDVDFSARMWTIHVGVAKNELQHLVPLSNWAISERHALKRLAGDSPWIVPTEDGSDHAQPALITRGVSRCLKRFKAQGIKKFRTHDLRRTCRTGLGQLKVPHHIAERVINHAQPGPYDLWAYIDEKREALEKWAQHLASFADQSAGHIGAAAELIDTASNHQHQGRR